MFKPRMRSNLLLAFTIVGGLILAPQTALMANDASPVSAPEAAEAAKEKESLKNLYGALISNGEAILALGQARMTAAAAILQEEPAPAQLVTRFETQMETGTTALNNMLAALDNLVPTLVLRSPEPATQLQYKILQFKNQLTDFHEKTATMKADFALKADQRELNGRRILSPFNSLTDELVVIRQQLDILYPATTADLAAHRRLQTNLVFGFENQTRAVATLLGPVISQQTLRPPYQTLGTAYVSRLGLLAEETRSIRDLGILGSGINELLIAHEQGNSLEYVMFEVFDISDVAESENPDQDPRDLVVDYGKTVDDFFQLTDKAETDIKYILDLSLLRQIVLLGIKL